MTRPMPPSPHGGASTLPGGSRLGFLVVAAVAQAVVLLGTFFMGLVWGGFTYLAALALTVIGFAPLIVLGLRRPPFALLVPAVSLIASLSLFQANETYLEATACTDGQLAAVESIAPPPGGRHDFRGESLNGCVARYRTEQDTASVLAHYRSAFEDSGWRLRPAQSADGVAAEKEGIVLDVVAAGEVEGGLVIVTLFDKPDHWD